MKPSEENSPRSQALLLTDRTVRALKAGTKRYEVRDLQMRGLAVRVSAKREGDANARKTFVMLARFPNSSSWDRRTIGEYDVVSLEEARDTVRNWRKKIKQGIDPQEEAKRKADEEARRKKNTFAAVAADYIDYIKPRLRRHEHVQRIIDNKLLPRWKDRLITDIRWRDVEAVIEAAVKRGTPAMAHHIFSTAQRVFNWAIEQGEDIYGITSSPCDRKRPTKIIGGKPSRERDLDEDEMRAFWRAANRTSYPFGPIVRLLLLTGARRSEVAEARWSEFDLSKKVWDIPAARMKSKAPHVVPLADEVIEILNALPRHPGCDLLFTYNAKREDSKPVIGFAKMKDRLDRRMLLAWRAHSRKAGIEREDFKPWVLHDLRRTMRTQLSHLGVSEQICELVIGHTKRGLIKTYNRYDYLKEKRHALELWAGRLRDIVEPAPANVVKLPVNGKQ
jgi:integrase